MATELDEVRVQIQQEGAEDAADTIGDSLDQGMEDGGGQAQTGGGNGGILGGISAKLAGILGFVAFLASLKPIQEILGGLQRLFNIAILPLVSLLSAFLRPILQRLLRFIGGLDFDNLLKSLITGLNTALNNLAEDVSNKINDALDVDLTPDQTLRGVGEGLLAGSAIGGLFGTRTFDEPGDVGRSVGNDPVIDFVGEATSTIFESVSELSPTAVDERSADKTSEQTQRNTIGSE